MVLAAWRSTSTALCRVIFVCNLDSLMLSSALPAMEGGGEGFEGDLIIS